MARTRAQLVAQKGRKRPRGIRKQRSTRRTSLQQRLAPERTECDQPHPSSTKMTLSRQGSATLDKRGTKRPVDVLDRDPEPPQKRPRRSPRLSLVEDTSDGPAANNGGTYEPINPIDYWAREGQWPQEYFEFDMEHLLARKKSLSSLVRKRLNSTTSTTPSDQKPREEKSAPYRDPRYETLLGTKGSFMVKSNLDIADTSKTLCKTLLEANQAVPEDSLFRDDIFESICQKIHNRNEARVIQNISRLIVLSAESFAIFGAKYLNILTESVNEGWNNSIFLTSIRP
ncbi:hypothetical protein DL769_001397 [Monosporascus sp. CRB-8-3]|nr:hypothetical protein DL769_001397 [Monosporascus sp. CRB-8-3]